MDSKTGWKRRTFLQGVVVGMPMLRMIGAAAAPPEDGAKFTPIDLGPYFNTSSAGFGHRERARQVGGPGGPQGDLVRTPGGKQELQGIPFLLGPEDVQQKSWITLSTAKQPWAVAKVEIPIGRTAACLCVAQFCDWDPNDTNPPDVEAI